MSTRLHWDGLADQLLLPPPGQRQTEAGDGGPQWSLLESLARHEQFGENVFQVPGETEINQRLSQNYSTTSYNGSSGTFYNASCSSVVSAHWGRRGLPGCCWFSRNKFAWNRPAKPRPDELSSSWEHCCQVATDTETWIWSISGLVIVKVEASSCSHLNIWPTWEQGRISSFPPHIQILKESSRFSPEIFSKIYFKTTFTKNYKITSPYNFCYLKSIQFLFHIISLIIFS